MKLTKKLEAEVLALYKDYWDAYLKGDLKTFASYLDENIVVYGTAVGEIFTNKKDAVKFYTETADQMTGKADFRNRTFKLKANRETIVIFEQSDLYVLMDGVWTFYDSARITGILEKKGNSWKVVHQHGSFPDSRTDEGDQISTDKIKAENLRLKKAIKRRTLELENKNRELEIEAALEKVRTIAMGMRKPEDMLDVCKTISLQLQSLGVKEIRNVQTAIFYEQRGTYMNYEFYAKHDKTFITETIFTNNKIHNEFATKMMMGRGETFITHIKGDEVKDWIAYQKTTNVFIDKSLETASSLNYYWFSLGPVALGISTYNPLTEDEINLFKKFLKVFELAYQRYLDIEKAEVQAREAQIEASLERVRAVAMSMQKPDDLLGICEVSFNEFKKLGIDNIRNALIHIQYDNQKYFMDYDFSDLTGGAITKIEYGSHPIVEDYLKQIRSAKDAFYQGVIKEDQLEEWKDFRRNSGQIDDPRLDKATALYYYFFSIGIGDIGISTLKSIDESQIKILKRFRNVFDLAYRRYTDITLAEAQAREARIEVALEKIRSRALAMRNSSEAGNVSTLLFSELEKMDINPSGFSIMIFDEELDKYELWRAKEVAHQGAYETFSIKEMYDKFDKYVPGFSEELKSAWTKGNPFFVVEFRGEKRVSFLQANREMANYSDEDFEKMKKGWPDPTCWHLVFFKYGWIGVLQNKQLIKEDLLLIQRFAEVFDFAYTRFLDLQKAEAQAKEAKIEAALERVRSRTMAMQKSDELGDVAVVLFYQMNQLVSNLWTCGFVLCEKDRDEDEWWLSMDDDFTRGFFLPNVGDYAHATLYDGWLKGDPFRTVQLDGNDLQQHYDWLMDIPVSRTIFEEMDAAGLARPTWQKLHAAYFSKGYLVLITREPCEEEEIFKRFAQVFDLTYTRFLDLQKAEAQAREAKIEAALERVRSRTMGMQKSEELKEVIRVVYEQFIHLKINVDHAGFVIDYTPKGDWHFWIADEQDIPSKITHPYFESVWANQFNEAKEKGADFFATNLNFEEKNKFYNELLSYVPGLPETSKDFYLNCPGLAATTVLFENVSLYIENFSGIPYTDEENATLMRFGKVFQQTYTRFLDLIKVEAQNKIIQADNDRKTKELEEARQLQLSMLPKELPKLAHLDIAVYMKTATEVGGDYYDFNIDDNGTLTVLVGDATGHGMMSGMMVSIMKSFFISNRRSIDLKQFFENANNSLKEMHLGRLMMPMIGVQINSEKLIATNAGMPSLLYFRNKSQKAGEFVSNNLPLGGMKGTQYLLKEIRYEKGDVLLLMSDGFAELKNENNEQYGYTSVKEQFRAISHKSANEIIEELKDTASQWLNESEPDDDVTFVVIKIK